MPKLKDKKAMKRYDFRIPEELINELYKMPISIDKNNSKPKDISRLIHDVINTIICSGAYMIGEPLASKTSIEKSEALLKNYPKTVAISFRENPDKIKFLQYFYRIKKYGYYESNIKLPTPSAVIRACIFDIINNNVIEESIKPSDTICPYDGQKNQKMNDWINCICKEIVSVNHLETYCEPFMGSANTFLHLDDELIDTYDKNNSFQKEPLAFTNFYLNDIDIFTYSLIQTIKSNLPAFIASVSSMPCNKTEFNYITNLIYPSPTSENIERTIDELSPIQKAVYLYYRQLVRFRNSKKTLEKAYCHIVTKSYKYDEFAFPISATFYSPINSEKGGNTITAYAVEHNLTNYFKLLNRTRKLGAISRKLQRVQIHNLDFTKFMEERLKTPNTLYYIDSPYFYSEDVYAQDEFDHQKLADLVKQIHAPHNFFIMSNRVTVCPQRKKTGLTNQDAIDMSNKFYAGCGYFYELVLFKRSQNFNACQVEIIISNFPFTGYTAYDHNITEDEVNDCIINQKVSPNCLSKEWL